MQNVFRNGIIQSLRHFFINVKWHSGYYLPLPCDIIDTHQYQKVKYVKLADNEK
jgi:hypothetical protein